MTPGQITLDVEQFRNRFFLEGCPHWTVHNATRTSELMGRFRPDKEFARTAEETMIYSWMQLEEFFTAFSGGLGKFILRKNPTDNVRNSLTIYVRWGTSGPSVAGIGNSVSAHHQTDQPSWAMIFQMQETKHKETLEMMKELIETRRDLEDAHAAIEGASAPGLQERLIEQGMNIASAYLMGNAAQPQGQLGTLGADGGQHPQDVPTTGSQSQEVPVNDRPVSHDQLSRAAEVVAANVPYHPNDVFGAIALFCQNQPGQAANYIGMLIAQVKNQGQDVG